MQLFLCSLISAATGTLLGLLLGLQALDLLLFSLIPLALSWTIGEYILPMLIHLSQEDYNLQDKVSQGLNMISYGNSGLEAQRWRIFVSDDDAQVITAVGRRTLILTRGCFNLRPGDFRCALQEAFEQRVSDRSNALLIATIGNPFYLGSRIMCRIGRLLLRMIAWPIGLIIALVLPNRRGFFAGFRRGMNSIAVSQTIADWLYSVLCWLLIRLSNLMLYAYSPILNQMDLAVDSKLKEMNLQNVMIQLITANAETPYRSRIPRENCIIHRPRPATRIEALRVPRQMQQFRPNIPGPEHTAPRQYTSLSQPPQRSLPRPAPQRPVQRSPQQAVQPPQQAASTSTTPISSTSRPRLRILDSPTRTPVTEVEPAPDQSNVPSPSGTGQTTPHKIRILP